MTIKPDEQGQRLARELDRQIDNWLAEFVAIIDAKDENQRRDGALLVISQNSGKISRLKDFFFKITVGGLYFAYTRLSEIYSVAQIATIDESAARALRIQLNTRLDGFVIEAEMISAATGQDEVEGLVDLLTFSAGNRNLLRKGVEFAAEFSLQDGTWQGGAPHFRQKIASATLDDKTTNLCRDRMDGQIRPWNEPFVDPISGSEWQHPPFVGGKLASDEIYHSCRTVMLPFRA